MNDGQIRFRGVAQCFSLPRQHWRELERLSLDGDPERQAALNRFLIDYGWPGDRIRSANLVTTEGKNAIGAAYFPNGSHFVLQKGAGTVVLGDTAASHAWTELTTYTQATRPALTLGAWSAGSADNNAAPAIYTAPTGGLTFNGWGVINASGKGGTTGRLYSAADHGSPQAIAAGSALRQTLTATFS